MAAVATAIGGADPGTDGPKETVEPAHRSEPRRGLEAARPRDAAGGWLFPDERPELPGPVERTLHDLGITNPDLLQRGADIDAPASG